MIPVLDTGLTVLAAFCAMRIIWVDVRKLEIEFETLSGLAGVLLLEAALFLPAFEIFLKLFCSVAFFLCVHLFARLSPRLIRMGAGDPPLIAVTAFMVAPWILTWSFASGAAIVITAATYSHIRGKRLFRSIYPAALPLVGAALPIYLVIEVAR